MDPDFVVLVKSTIFWLNWGLRVHMDLYALDFPKCSSKDLFATYQPQTRLPWNPNDIFTKYNNMRQHGTGYTFNSAQYTVYGLQCTVDLQQNVNYLNLYFKMYNFSCTPCLGGHNQMEVISIYTNLLYYITITFRFMDWSFE